MQLAVLSIGGSLVCPEKPDTEFLRQLKALFGKLGGYRFIIVVGGGRVAREYQQALKELGKNDSYDLDLIGIEATKLNASLVKAILGKEVHLIDKPKKIMRKNRIIISHGWKPGFSTDYCAVRLAILNGCTKVINLTNIKKILDKEGKQRDYLSWKEYLDIVGRKWSPGLSTPFDPIASQEAQQARLEVIIVDGHDLGNVEKAIKGEMCVGTHLK